MRRCVSLLELLICLIASLFCQGVYSHWPDLNTVCFCLCRTLSCFLYPYDISKGVWPPVPWPVSVACVFLFWLLFYRHAVLPGFKVIWALVPYLFLTPMCTQDIFRLLTIENLFKGPPELVMGHSRVHSGLDSIISCGHAAKSSSSLQSFPPSEALNNSLAPLHNKSQMWSACI